MGIYGHEYQRLWEFILVYVDTMYRLYSSFYFAAPEGTPLLDAVVELSSYLGTL